MKKIAALGFGVIIMLFFACSKQEKDTSCESVPCTEEFRWVAANVVDEQGNPVALSHAKITRLSNGQDLTREYEDYEWEIFQSKGSYHVATDLDGQILPRHEDIQLRFQGYIGTEEVVNALYVVAFDCCHISLVSGERELVVR